MADPQRLDQPQRPVLHRTSGTRLGPITRMMSPGGLGQAVKPFVFLDLFEMPPTVRRGFAPHPHSGIATLTTFLQGAMTYGDTTGKRGAMSVGSVEWMQAGSGVWHAGEPAPGQAMRGYQLWVALPPELELTAAQSLYLEGEKMESVGPARILLGSYDGKASPIRFPVSIVYLHVRLVDGESWIYQPAADHEIAWLATNAGRLHVSSAVLEREMAVFAEGNGAIEIIADDSVEFVIGSAVKHPYPLVTGEYSVHTSRTALAEGERTIADLRRSTTFTELSRR